ncbi:MAG: hypothetical protein AB1649_09250, partial [Chloroflexota bacterium]
FPSASVAQLHSLLSSSTASNQKRPEEARKYGTPAARFSGIFAAIVTANWILDTYTRVMFLLLQIQTNVRR